MGLGSRPRRSQACWRWRPRGVGDMHGPMQEDGQRARGASSGQELETNAEGSRGRAWPHARGRTEARGFGSGRKLETKAEGSRCGLGTCRVELVQLFGCSIERKGERDCAMAEGEVGAESSGSKNRESRSTESDHLTERGRGPRPTGRGRGEGEAKGGCPSSRGRGGEHSELPRPKGRQGRGGSSSSSRGRGGLPELPRPKEVARAPEAKRWGAVGRWGLASCEEGSPHAWLHAKKEALCTWGASWPRMSEGMESGLRGRSGRGRGGRGRGRGRGGVGLSKAEEGAESEMELPWNRGWTRKMDPRASGGCRVAQKSEATEGELGLSEAEEGAESEMELPWNRGWALWCHDLSYMWG